MESGFRVLVELANVGKFWAFVDPQNHDRVDDFKNHLKDLFSLSDPQITIDGVLLPPKETIRIINPSDVLSVKDSESDQHAKQKSKKEKRLDLSSSEVFCFPSISDFEVEVSESVAAPSLDNSTCPNEDPSTQKKKRKRQRKKNTGAELIPSLESSSTNLNTFLAPPPPPCATSKNDKRRHILFSEDGETIEASAPIENDAGPSGDASSHPVKPKQVRVQHMSATLSYPTQNIIPLIYTPSKV